MKYIVTGGLGFIGSEICRQLLDKSKYSDTESVLIIDDNSKGYGTTKIIDILEDSRLKIWYMDLSEQEKTRSEWFDGANQNFIYHLCQTDYIICCAAKIGGIGYFNKIPATILDDNNLILSNILRAISQLKPKERPHLVYMSSSMVFESAETFPSKESDVQNIRVPITAYGFQKLAGEYYCKAFYNQHGVRYTIVRPFNAVGPEKPDPNFVGYSHVLPDFVCKIKNGQGTEENPLVILGDGEQIRHYTDVKEVAEGILIATHHPKSINEDFNIAIGQGHSVLEVAELVWQSMSQMPFTGNANMPNLYIKNIQGFAHDVKFRSPDITKTKNILGWEAKITLEDNINEIVQSVLTLI
jgi:nucleoside-diphosphate-sugar epimerase